MEQTSRGYAVWRAFLAGGMEGGRMAVAVALWLGWRDFLDGLFGGLRGVVGMSESEGEGVGRAELCLCFFCWRFSLRLEGMRKPIAESLSLVSGVEVRGISGLVAGICSAATGLATCARVSALFMMQVDQMHGILGCAVKGNDKTSTYAVNQSLSEY
jgi:hypothetical protein